MGAQVDHQAVQRALAAILAGDQQLRTADQQTQTAKQNADDALRDQLTAADREYRGAEAAAKQQLGGQIEGARSEAQRLASQTIPGLQEYAALHSVNPGTWAGGEPRQIAVLQQHFESLRQRGETMTFLSEIELARNSEKKPVLRWIWLGLVAAGFLLLIL